MPPTVNLKRKDGSTFAASPEQAARLEVLGYSREAPEEESARVAEAAQKTYYEDQKFETGVEGFVSGVSAGTSDFLLDEDGRNRAKYNPGTRMATEIAGMVAPAVLSGGASLASPAGLIARGAKAVGGLAERGAVRGALVGATEGAAWHVAGNVSKAAINEEPLTLEGAVHGLGWSTLIGGGMGALGSKLEGAGERLGSRLASEADDAVRAVGTADEAAERASHVARTNYFDDTVAYGRTVKAADDIVATTKAEWGGLRGEITGLKKSVDEVTKAADDAMEAATSGIHKRAQESGLPVWSDPTSEIKAAYTKAVAAAKGGKPEKLDEALKALDEAVAPHRIEGFNPSKALKDVATLHAATRELDRFPTTADAFINMRTEKFDRAMGALDTVRSTGASPTLVQAVDDRIAAFAQRLGTSSTDLREIRTTIAETIKAGKAAKMPKQPKIYKAVKEAAAEGVTSTDADKPGLLRRGAALVGGSVAFGKTMAFTGSMAAAGAAASAARAAIRGGSPVAALVAAKNRAVNRVQTAAASFMPKAGRGLKRSGGAAAWLGVKLDGSQDTSSKDPQVLAQNRIDEVWGQANSIGDRLYKAVEPLTITQPGAAAGMHALALQSFRELQMVLPKDPGVVSAFKPIWKPSSMQAAVMAKQLRVFHDPVGAAEEMLSTGDLDPISIKMLKRVAPSLYQELRVGLLHRLGDPAVQKDLTYNDMIGISTLIDVPFHSSMRPEQIAASQARFQLRNEPLATPGSPGGDNPGPDKSPMATQANRLTER